MNRGSLLFKKIKPTPSRPYLMFKTGQIRTQGVRPGSDRQDDKILGPEIFSHCYRVFFLLLIPVRFFVECGVSGVE